MTGLHDYADDDRYHLACDVASRTASLRTWVPTEADRYARDPSRNWNTEYRSALAEARLKLSQSGRRDRQGPLVAPIPAPGQDGGWPEGTRIMWEGDEV